MAGRTALITGGSKGIGFGCARALAAEGCRVALAARDAETLETAAETLRGAGAEVSVHAIDLSLGGSAAELLGRAGVPDILVNNAGAIPGGDVAAIDEARWREAWDLKVFGYINLARAAYAAMKARGHGVIVNVTGLAADRPDFNYIAGTAGNASLNAFTRALGSYALEDGIRVVAVSPGAVATDRLIGLMRTRAEAETGDPRALAEHALGPAHGPRRHGRGGRRRGRLHGLGEGRLGDRDGGDRGWWPRRQGRQFPVGHAPAARARRAVAGRRELSNRRTP